MEREPHDEDCGDEAEGDVGEVVAEGDPGFLFLFGLLVFEEEGLDRGRFFFH